MTALELAVQALIAALQAFLVAAGSLATVTFTIPPPVVNLHEWYFAASGLDTNDCHITTPCKTIDKFNTLVFAAGDVVCFNGGESFAGTPTITPTQLPNGDVNNPLIIKSCGTGQATILANNPGPSTVNQALGNKSFGVLIDGVRGVLLQNLIISANGTATQFGILVQNSTGGITSPVDGITIQGNDVSGFYLVGATSDFSSEVFVTGFAYVPGGGTACGVVQNVKVLNNVLHGVNGPTSQDDNGITGQSCDDGGFSPSNVINPTYSGNHVFDIGGHCCGNGNGIMFRSNGGLAENNLVHDVAANTHSCGGPVGLWVYRSQDVVIQNNEVHHVHSTNWIDNPCDYGAFDADSGSTNIIFQYNYGHHNDGPCFLAYGGEGLPHGPVTFRYNICVENNTTTNDGGGEIAMTTEGVVLVYNNTFYKTFHKDPGTLPPSCWSGSWTSLNPAVGSVWANNICYTTATDQYFRSQYNLPTTNSMTNVYLKMDGNLWFGAQNWSAGGDVNTLAAWKTATSADTHAVNADPMFVNSGTGTAVGFKLQSGSPALGIGIDLTAAPFSLDVGTQDFFGNPISRNIGADATVH